MSVMSETVIPVISIEPVSCDSICDTDIKYAVDVNNITFGYTKRSKVLNKLSIQIPEGKIFALLGSNGCGKTTLLKCILGRIKPKSGTVQVFGGQPGTKYSDIPGPGVGYMPQDIALFPELTIKQTLHYYGLIYHLKKDFVDERVVHLTQLLNLPKSDKLVSQSSGGQQRLVSIAVTMIHSPKLLILDEPTVGVDSILRCRIWQYLENICRTEGKTVIITTHYIEEAKTASTVGFVDSGKILTQSNPNQLLNTYNCSTLEEVFLKLCIISRNTRKSRKVVEINNKEHVARPDCYGYEYKHKFIDYNHMIALLWKCYLRTKGNPMILFLFYSIPVLVTIFLSICVGQRPENLPIAIHNGDPDSDLSNLYINQIDRKFLNYKLYDTNESAVDSVINGKNWFAVTMSRNFSEMFRTRFLDPLDLDEEELEFTKIKLYPDMTNLVVAVTVQQQLLETFQRFLIEFSTSLGYNPLTFTLPIINEKPIYGNRDFTFNEYVWPAVTLSALHVMPMMFAALSLILEKKSGHLERAFVTGIKPYEFLLSQIIQQILAIITQVMITLFVSVVFYQIEIKGSIFNAFLICVLQGLQGMSFGMLISVLLTNEVSVAVIVSSLIIPLWLGSGVVWPLEGIPSAIVHLLYWTPLTQPIETMRSIVLRGWGLSHWKIQLGFAVSLTYTIGATVLSFIALHFHYKHMFDANYLVSLLSLKSL